MQPKFKFAEGEKVLCFHGPLIYEAKALKSAITKDKQLKYFVHYAGWNKNWDEWVPENRVLKFNETNLQRQKELQKEHDAKKEKNRKNAPKGKKGELLMTTSKDSGAISSGGSESRASTPSKELTNLSTTTTTTVAGRGNRSKLNATPVTMESKKDTLGKEESTKEDKEEPAVKKKRGTSTSSSEKSSTNNAAASNSSTPVPPLPIVSAGPISNTTVTSSSVASNIRLDSCVESEETFLSKIEVKIKIPDELKQCLADDWDAITRQHKLLDIPAKITVQDIVDQYISFKKSAKSSNACKELAISDVLNGVVEYFNVMLGSQLLYKFERPQYADILQQYPDIPLSKLYGSFHLLRLFVKLGSMLGYSALDEKSMQLLLVHLHDFLKYLVKNSATFFSMASFVNVSPEYHRHTQ
ncbi:nuA4 complex subunit EAF3 homolog [Stomoxys calcitrans]|uniref:nuA4 complex subunit EAF3 homolog n=1 Tax=Stomoxys calcitrans TaxID=35570 RepID=UPI0027E2FBCC|nr:nuA4 complex subunit EAF3 homolog [Stomoxys calcitrans]